MDDNFLSFWFSGLDNALSEMDEDSAEIMLCECGKACSKSYTQKLYADIFAVSSDFDDFLKKLQEKISELTVRKSSENEYIFSYSRCLCDIAGKGFVHNSMFCKCSCSNLKYNLETVLGENAVEVSPMASILGGDEHCAFNVRIIRHN